jgi:hypothetical protein
MIAHTSLMINSAVSHAKKQLELHAQKGVNSNLSIYEVANLMDLVEQRHTIFQSEKKSIFFSASQN